MTLKSPITNPKITYYFKNTFNSDSIVALAQLHTLDLTANNLAALPANFYEMRGLKQAHGFQNFHKHGLWLHQNPLKTPPKEVWRTEDPQKIFEYMKRLRVSTRRHDNAIYTIVNSLFACFRCRL